MVNPAAYLYQTYIDALLLQDAFGMNSYNSWNELAEEERRAWWAVVYVAESIIESSND